MYLTNNILLLRKRKGRTQDDVATSVNIKRSTYAGLEAGNSLPSIEVLIALSNYFNVAVDTLLKVDLQKLSAFQLSELERGNDVFIRGSNIRVIATTVNKKNEENIDLVPEKAKAGYALGFADPEYINELPKFNLPFLSKGKKYRTFQITGDSMLPIPEGSWVTTEFVQDWYNILSGKPYIVVTLNDGVVFKIVDNLIQNEGKLTLHSLNKLYKPYEVHVSDIKEVWKFVNFMSAEIPEFFDQNDNFNQKLAELTKEIDAIKQKINK
jgi:transcriptional regulator with XRE-family HTH domain